MKIRALVWNYRPGTRENKPKINFLWVYQFWIYWKNINSYTEKYTNFQYTEKYTRNWLMRVYFIGILKIGIFVSIWIWYFLQYIKIDILSQNIYLLGGFKEFENCRFLDFDRPVYRFLPVVSLKRLNHRVPEVKAVQNIYTLGGLNEV